MDSTTFYIKKLTYIKIIKEQNLLSTTLSFNNSITFFIIIIFLSTLKSVFLKPNMKKKIDNYYTGCINIYKTFTSENQKGKFLFHTIFFLIKSKLKGAET